MKIQDEFAKIPHRSARFYFRKKKKGLCVRCGKEKPAKGFTYCLECRQYKHQHHLKTYKLKEQTKHTARPSKYL